MPFGLVYGTVVFVALGLWGASRLLSVSSGPAKLLGLLVGVFLFSLGLGVGLRQRWARWLGVVTAASLVALSAVIANFWGGVTDFVVLLACLVAVVLLVIPATGDGRGGLPPDVKPFRRTGRVLAVVSVGALVLLVGAAGWGAADIARHLLRPTRVETSGMREPASTGQELLWLDYASGLDNAKSSGKPVFIDFFAAWCAPCKMMEQRTFTDPRVVERLGSFEVVRVDCEESEARKGFRGTALADRYGVEAYPTLVLLDAGGKELSRRTGFVGAAALVVWLDRQAGKAQGIAGARSSAISSRGESRSDSPAR